MRLNSWSFQSNNIIHHLPHLSFLEEEQVSCVFNLTGVSVILNEKVGLGINFSSKTNWSKLPLNLFTKMKIT